MPRPIKILHVIHSFNAGGLENGLVNIINGSPDHLVHELCILSEGVDFAKRLHQPVTCRQLYRRDGNDPRLIRRICEVVWQAKPHILHSRNWAAFDGVLASFFCPRVTVLHGEHGREIEDPHGRIRRRNLAMKLSSPRVKKFIAVSRDLHRWLSNRVRIPERKLILIPNGVDTNRFQPSRSPWLKQQLGIAAGEFVVGCVGRLDSIKNHEGLVRAVHLLNLQGAKVRLVIVGDGPNRSKLEVALKETNLIPTPILAGNQLQVDSYYGLFDVFVQNSFAEGMSNTLLEAMAAGLPVICTATGGNIELITHDVNGTYVQVGDDRSLAERIKHYKVSQPLRRCHGARARASVIQNFSLQVMVSRYVDLYEAAAG
jgi:sugar transferase (PEP-CTERM/EpsH1 system associated)